MPVPFTIFVLASQFHVYFTVGSTPVKRSFLNVKALVGAFNQEKVLVGAFSMIVNLCVDVDLHFKL